MAGEIGREREQRGETSLALGYFALWLAVCFVRPEGELLHWLTLVAIPLAVLTSRRRARPDAFRRALESIGIAKASLGRGLGWGIAVGIALSALQLAGRQGIEVRALLQTERALWLVPLAFALMCVTAATTEEIFFRGVLHTRIAASTGSKFAAIALGSLLFGIYHVPFAFGTANWGTHGDLGASLESAFAGGVPIGILIGVVYELSRRNLLATIVAHASINCLPGAVWLAHRL